MAQSSYNQSVPPGFHRVISCVRIKIGLTGEGYLQEKPINVSYLTNPVLFIHLAKTLFHIRKLLFYIVNTAIGIMKKKIWNLFFKFVQTTFPLHSTSTFFLTISYPLPFTICSPVNRAR